MSFLFTALSGVINIARAVYGWVTYSRTKNIGKMEGEIERRREEIEKLQDRVAKESSVSGLSRAAIVERLRRFKRRQR